MRALSPSFQSPRNQHNSSRIDAEQSLAPDLLAILNDLRSESKKTETKNTNLTAEFQPSRAISPSFQPSRAISSSFQPSRAISPSFQSQTTLKSKEDSLFFITSPPPEVLEVLEIFSKPTQQAPALPPKEKPSTRQDPPVVNETLAKSTPPPPPISDFLLTPPKQQAPPLPPKEKRSAQLNPSISGYPLKPPTQPAPSPPAPVKQNFEPKPQPNAKTSDSGVILLPEAEPARTQPAQEKQNSPPKPQTKPESDSVVIFLQESEPTADAQPQPEVVFRTTLPSQSYPEANEPHKSLWGRFESIKSMAKNNQKLKTQNEKIGNKIKQTEVLSKTKAQNEKIGNKIKQNEVLNKTKDSEWIPASLKKYTMESDWVPTNLKKFSIGSPEDFRVVNHVGLQNDKFQVFNISSVFSYI